MKMTYDDMLRKDAVMLPMVEKYRAMRDAYFMVCDAHHKLANIVDNSRHVAVGWTTCNEQTCAMFRDRFNEIEMMK